MTTHPLALGHNVRPAWAERALWAAVLLQALKDAAGIGNTNERIKQEAQGWLTSANARAICRLIGLNPKKLRRPGLLNPGRPGFNSPGPIQSHIGARINQVRVNYNLTLRQCAKLAGVSYVTIQRTEKDPGATFQPKISKLIHDFLKEYENGDSDGNDQFSLVLGWADPADHSFDHAGQDH